MSQKEQSCVSLISLDKENEATEIPIPNGDTVIGRGPMFQILDKRVSRSHAVIAVKDGSIEIKPIHSNPTFYKASQEDKYIILPKDKWKKLEDKDRISLLPNDLKFEMKVATEEHIENNDAQKVGDNIQGAKQINNADNSDAKPSAITFGMKETKKEVVCEGMEKQETIPWNIKDNKADNEIGLHADTNLKGAEGTNNIPDGRDVPAIDAGKPALRDDAVYKDMSSKKRILPSWMATSDSHSDGPDIKKRRKSPAKVKPKAKKEADEVKQVKAKEDNITVQSRQVSSDKGNVTMQPQDSPSKPCNVSTSTVTTHEQPSNILGDTEVKQDDILLLIRVDKENKELSVAPVFQQPTSTLPVSTTSKTVGDGKEERGDRNQQMAPPATVNTAAAALPVCPYGSKCYRKNPVHFQEYSHDESAGDLGNTDDNLPECPYGSRCYRKNPQHFKEFKHSSTQDSDDEDVQSKRKPQRKKGRRSIVSDDSDDDGEPNTYDYNDSFLNDDDSSDSGSNYSDEDDDEDDSDFNPGSSDEDVRDLVSEAMTFVGNKKFHRK